MVGLTSIKKISMEKTQTLNKINKDSFEVTETRTVIVDKKQLMREIEELQSRITEKENLTGITSMREKLQAKQALLEEANQLK